MWAGALSGTHQDCCLGRGAGAGAARAEAWHGMGLLLGCTGSCSFGRGCWSQIWAGAVLGWTWQAG